MEANTVANIYLNEANICAVLLDKGNSLYKEGGHFDQSAACAEIAGDSANFLRIESLRLLLWSRRYEGLEAKDDPELRAAKYAETVTKANELMGLSEYDKNRYINERISARNALILIPGQPIAKLCEEGLQELDGCTLTGNDKGNLQGGLYNSWGAALRLPDTVKAEELLLKGLEVTESFTTMKGNLYNNLSDCYKNYGKDKALSREKRSENLLKARECLESALTHYPKDEEKHIRGAKNKIKNLKEEIDKFNEEI